MSSIIKRILFFSVLIFSSCSDEQTYYPDVWVNEQFFISSYPELNIAGNHAVFKGGIAGVIVYKNAFEEFVAYDCACPEHPKFNCAVKSIAQGNSILECPCCGSKFSLMDGSPVKGPASIALKKYYVRNTNGMLFISN